jgi:hypothetical protein
LTNVTIDDNVKPKCKTSSPEKLIISKRKLLLIEVKLSWLVPSCFTLSWTKTKNILSDKIVAKVLKNGGQGVCLLNVRPVRNCSIFCKKLLEDVVFIFILTNTKIESTFEFLSNWYWVNLCIIFRLQLFLPIANQIKLKIIAFGTRLKQTIIYLLLNEENFSIKLNENKQDIFF